MQCNAGRQAGRQTMTDRRINIEKIPTDMHTDGCNQLTLTSFTSSADRQIFTIVSILIRRTEIYLKRHYICKTFTAYSLQICKSIQAGRQAVRQAVAVAVGADADVSVLMCILFCHDFVHFINVIVVV